MAEWIAAGRMIGGEPWEIERIHRYEVGGDRDLARWKSRLPPECTLLLVYDKRSHGELLSWTEYVREAPSEEEMERKAERRKMQRRRKDIARAQRRKPKFLPSY